MPQNETSQSNKDTEKDVRTPDEIDDWFKKKVLNQNIEEYPDDELPLPKMYGRGDYRNKMTLSKKRWRCDDHLEDVIHSAVEDRETFWKAQQALRACMLSKRGQEPQRVRNEDWITAPLALRENLPKKQK